MAKHKIFTTSILLIIVSASNVFANQAAVDVSSGYRLDSLNWSIAGNTQGRNPNILSELSWQDLQMATLGAGGRYQYQRWLLEAEVQYGYIYSGKNQDSDYYFNNRRGEFSRSNNGSDGDTIDFSIAVGLPIDLGIKQGWQQTLIPRAGYSFHQQRLTIINGYQTIPANGPFNGLNTSYDSQWNGGWVGASLISEQQQRLRIDISYHLPNYYAEANWNLRQDLAHPKSFEQWANGHGISIGMQVRIPYKKLELIAAYKLRRWSSEPGHHRVYLASGQGISTQLNDVNWSSQQLSIGLEYLFAGKAP